MNEHRRIGVTMYVLASVVVLALLTLLFDDALEQQRNPNTDPESAVDAAGLKSITLQRNRTGHYVASGFVNGEPVEFLLDTGATDVSIPGALADRLRLPRGVRTRAMTANGMTSAFSTTLEQVRIGVIEEFDVRASIVPNFPGAQVLLGMSFLERLDFSQRGDTLVLTQRSPR